MLAVHWSPVKNTTDILHNGIRKSKSGVFCFPLTGQPSVDKWWANSFRQWRPRTSYNGFVFRITEDDLPAAFSHWLHGSDDKPLTSIAQIKAEFESAIMYRIGERHFGYSLEADVKHGDEYERVGREIVARNPQCYLEALDGDADFLGYVFEDYQIVLSRSISPRRISHIMSGGNDYGRNIARKKKEQAFKSRQFSSD
jgi:hypothetical protein